VEYDNERKQDGFFSNNEHASWWRKCSIFWCEKRREAVRELN
jgi:hypothetical protein